MIMKAKTFLNRKAFLTLHYSFVYTYMTYCNHVWGTACVSNIYKIMKMFTHYFKINSDIHKYNTRQSLHIHVPQVKSELGEKVFVNCLMRCIRQNQLLVFRTKMHLSCNGYYLSPMICCVMLLCIMVVTLSTLPLFAPLHPLLISVVLNRYGACGLLAPFVFHGQLMMEYMYDGASIQLTYLKDWITYSRVRVRGDI